MTAVDLSDDEAKLILLALNAYRHASDVRLPDRSARIDALTARIIWRENRS